MALTRPTPPPRSSRKKAGTWTRYVYRGWLHAEVECEGHWDRRCERIRVREIPRPRKKAKR